MGQANNFGDWFLGLRKCAEAGWIRESVDLFNELKRHEIEYEGLLVEHHNHHIFTKLDIHNELIGIESNFCPIFLLVIIPNDYFISLLLIHQHNNIRLVHHFHERNMLAKILHLFLQSCAARVVLQNFKPSLRCNGKILLRLI